MNVESRRNLWKRTKGQRTRFVGAIVAMALGIHLLFRVPRWIRAAIDGEVGFWPAAGAIIALTACGGFFHYLRGRWAAQASEGVVRRLRDELYDHLQRLPLSYFDKAQTGDLVQRCSSDVETVRVFMAAQIVDLARSTLLVVLVLPELFALDVPLAWGSIALFPLILMFAFIFFGKVKAYFLRADEAEGRMSAALQENLTGVRVVRAFARQDFEREKFGKPNAEFRDKTNRLIQLLALYWSLSDILCMSQLGAVLVFGSYRLAEGAITIGTLVAVLSYANMVIWPFRQTGRLLADLGKAMVALGRIGEVFASPQETRGGGISDGAMRVEAKDLTFGYGDDDPALRGLSLRAEPGETIALLGAPGAGKSTLIKLLLRLYDFEEGSLTLNGVDVRELDRGAVRAVVAAVLQEPFLYSKTVADNLRVGDDSATEETMHSAAQAAGVHDDLSRFENGYHTPVGERGVTLSGGQRQRVALARALLREAPLLVLDDAMSAVDTGTESRIREALAERAGKRTTILIAHRLSTVAHADRLYVMEHGRVVQEGTHQELASRPGPYRRLWEIQGALEDEIEAQS